MIAKFSNNLTDMLQKNKVIAEDDREIYEFGLERLITYTLNILTTLLIGFVLGLPVESLFFSVAFIFMRHNNGGAHASSNLACYFLGTASILACLYTIDWAVSNGIKPIAIFLVLIPFAIIVLLLTPVEDSNKPLDDLEREVYRQRGIVTLAITVATALCLMMLNLFSLGCAVSGAIVLTSTSMLIGHFKNRIIDRKLYRQ